MSSVTTIPLAVPRVAVPLVAVLVAQLPRAAAAVVWVIVLAGLGVFIWRRLQGVPIRGPRTDSSEPSSSPGSPGPSLGSGDGMPPVVPPLPTPSFPPLSSPSSPSSPPPSPPSSPPAAVPPAFPASTAPPAAGAAPGEARSGFFAPAASAGAAETAGSPAAPGERATVGEAVRGIVMPCGLAPVIDGSQSIPNPFRAAFLTTAANAATVGSGLADELERLGFTLSTSTPTELLARRDAIELRVVLYVNPAAATRGLERLFPAAPPGAVGVELST